MMLNLNFDGARPECIDAEHHATASITARDGPLPARFRPVSFPTSYKYDTVLTSYHQAEGKTDTTTATTSYQALATHSMPITNDNINCRWSNRNRGEVSW